MFSFLLIHTSDCVLSRLPYFKTLPVYAVASDGILIHTDPVLMKISTILVNNFYYQTLLFGATILAVRILIARYKKTEMSIHY